MKERRTWWIRGPEEARFREEWNSLAARKGHWMSAMGTVAIPVQHPDCEAFAQFLDERKRRYDLRIEAANFQVCYTTEDLLKCEIVQIESDDATHLPWQEFRSMFEHVSCCASCERGTLKQKRILRLSETRLRGDLVYVQTDGDLYAGTLLSGRMKTVLAGLPGVSFEPVLEAGGEVSTRYELLKIEQRMPGIVPPTRRHWTGLCAACGGFAHFCGGDSNDMRTMELCFPRTSDISPIALTREHRGKQSHLHESMASLIVSGAVYRELSRAALRVGGIPAHLVPALNPVERARLDKLSEDLRRSYGETGA